MKADGREDGPASFAGFKLCVEKFKEAHSEVTELDWVRTDGAGCFAGIEFAMGLALMHIDSGLPVNEHHIGEAGNNKNSQDAHFAKLGRAASRLVDSGHHDIDSELALAQAVAKIGLKNTVALLYTPDRSYKLKLAPVEDLKLMSQRVFEKGHDGVTVTIRLHQQSFLGEGKVIEVDKLLIGVCSLPAARLAARRSCSLPLAQDPATATWSETPRRLGPAPRFRASLTGAPLAPQPPRLPRPHPSPPPPPPAPAGPALEPPP